MAALLSSFAGTSDSRVTGLRRGRLKASSVRDLRGDPFEIPRRIGVAGSAEDLFCSDCRRLSLLQSNGWHSKVNSDGLGVEKAHTFGSTQNSFLRTLFEFLESMLRLYSLPLNSFRSERASLLRNRDSSSSFLPPITSRQLPDISNSLARSSFLPPGNSHRPPGTSQSVQHSPDQRNRKRSSSSRRVSHFSFTTNASGHHASFASLRSHGVSHSSADLSPLFAPDMEARKPKEKLWWGSQL